MVQSSWALTAPLVDQAFRLLVGLNQFSSAGGSGVLLAPLGILFLERDLGGAERSEACSFSASALAF